MKKLFLLVILFFCMTTTLSALPTQPCTGLSWTAPTTNADGSPLTDLAGYRIYWSLTSGTFIDADRHQLDTAVNILFTAMTGLTSPDNMYFTVTAFDSAGNESGYSNIVTIDSPPGTPGGLNCFGG